MTKQTRERREEYKEKNKELRRRITEIKNQYWEKRCGQIEGMIGGARSTEVWKTIKGMKTNNAHQHCHLISMGEWKKYYGQLLTENRSKYKQTAQQTIEERNDMHLLITEEETKKHVLNMKNLRSPGPGNIAIELVKYGGKEIINRVTNLLNKCITSVQIPEEWRKAYIISVFKKGNRKDPGCYRGLSVTSSISRLFGKILQEKVRANVGNTISEDQSGFIPGRSCIDNLFTLQQIVEKKISTGEEIHLAFIDLEKAYDSIPQSKLWEALAHF